MGLAFSSYRDDPCDDGYGQSSEIPCPNCGKCALPSTWMVIRYCSNCGEKV